MKKFADLKIVVLAAAVLSMTACAPSSDTEDNSSDGSGTNTIAIVGDYDTACTAVAGSAIGGGTHQKTTFRFGYNGAHSFEAITAIYTSSACTTEVYSSDQPGAFTVGSATTSPSGGYLVTFTIDHTYVSSHDTTAAAAMNSGCTHVGSAWDTSGSTGSVRELSSGTYNSCNLNLVASGSTLYNVVVVSGNTLSMGAPTGNNPGVTTSGAVATSTSLALTK